LISFTIIIFFFQALQILPKLWNLRLADRWLWTKSPIYLIRWSPYPVSWIPQATCI
jgi:hypothetical protein